MCKRLIQVVFVLALVVLGLSACSSIPTGSRNGAVVLDIGHFIGGEGASTPGAINGKIIRECAFWYEYAYYVKREIERSGYKCVVCNRGNAPTTEPLRSLARRAGVVQLRRPAGDVGIEVAETDNHICLLRNLVYTQIVPKHLKRL